MNVNRKDILAGTAAQLYQTAESVGGSNAHDTPITSAIVTDALVVVIGKLNAMQEQIRAMQTGFNRINDVVQPRLSKMDSTPSAFNTGASVAKRKCQ